MSGIAVVAPPETQASVVAWANETFSPASSLFRVACRVNEEMAEFLRAVSAGDKAGAAEKAADVVIVAFRAAEMIGFDLLAEAEQSRDHLAGLSWAGEDALAANANNYLALALFGISIAAPPKVIRRNLSIAAIMLNFILARWGISLQTAINLKMAINRARQWHIDGTGHGYHVRPGEAT